MCTSLYNFFFFFLPSLKHAKCTMYTYISYQIINCAASHLYLDLYRVLLADPSGVRLLFGTEACAHDVEGCQDGGYEESRPVLIRNGISILCLLCIREFTFPCRQQLTTQARRQPHPRPWHRTARTGSIRHGTLPGR